jgi:dienelactone hydrolase
MTQVVLFHHAQGLRPDVVAWADSLRDAGHEVETPDLYEGVIFDRLEDGIAHRDELGLPALIQRAGESLDGLPEDLVYAGFSMGASAAHYFAVTRPGGRGVLLMHGTAPAGWSTGMPGQLHKKDLDPLMDEGGPEELRKAADAVGAPVEIFSYPGTGHLFADPDGPDYDEASASLMLERELAFLARL